MFRKISLFLKQWKNNKYRKPLIIQGARQVGKTYSILEFGKKNFENVAYFNFQTNPVYSKCFDENITPEYLIPMLSHLCGQTIIAGKTLIVFDEIQLCQKALTSLKYFCELAPEYHVISAGSLLGIAVNRNSFSFPVGKVDRITMHPLDIEEFMLAFSENKTIEIIKDCFASNSPMPAVLHEASLNLYKKYLIIGGMPEAVARFIETSDFTLVRHIQNSILSDYLDDMSKYQATAKEIQKTRQTYNNITVQLSKKNTRFIYKLIKKGARASEFENAIEWLILANIVSRVNRLEQVKKPLENYIDIDAFKIYMSDLGLLCAKNEIAPNDILFGLPEINDFKGGIAENYVNIHLNANGYKAYYWETLSYSEIDFLINKNNSIIPIEVKSEDNTRSKSLIKYIQSYKPEYAIKISSKNFAYEDGIKHIPHYAVFCI